MWYKENLSLQEPDLDFSLLKFEEVTFDNGKSYLYVSNFPENAGFGNQYIGVQNGVPIVIGNSGLMPISEINGILSTLDVKNL